MSVCGLFSLKPNSSLKMKCTRKFSSAPTRLSVFQAQKLWLGIHHSLQNKDARGFFNYSIIRIAPDAQFWIDHGLPQTALYLQNGLGYFLSLVFSPTLQKQFEQKMDCTVMLNFKAGLELDSPMHFSTSLHTSQLIFESYFTTVLDLNNRASI